MAVVFRFARAHLVPYIPWYVAGILMLALTNWIAVTIPVVVAEAVDSLRAGDAGVGVKQAAVRIAMLGLAVIATRTLSRVAFFTPGRLVEARIKKHLFSRLMRQQPSFHALWPAGDLVSRASSDLNFVRLLSGFGALQICNATMAISLVAFQMINLSPRLAMWVLVPVVIGLTFALGFIRRMFHLVHRMQQALAELSDLILSSYRGVATIQGFLASEAFLGRFDEKNEEHLQASLLRAQMRAAIGPVLSLTASINVFLLLFLGGPMAIRGEISVGELIAFTMLIAYIAGPLRSMSFLLAILKQAQAAIERINEVMDPEPDRPDLPSAGPAPTAAPHLEVRQLNFAYPGHEEQPVLRSIDLDIPAGSTLGVFGPTGSGKTTLLRCLSRLYNPPAGTVYIDGEDCLEVDLDGYREHMAFVPQRAFLFSDSVRQNILMGQADDGRLDKIIDLAALSPDLEALPRGLDTQVGETGVMLSGGQRQRTALARGLARPHGLLILDDVLSAVDHKTESELLDALRSAPHRPTTIIVANRISALAHADSIAVLEDGRITALGTHDELVASDSIYREAWERQREGDGA